MNKNCQNNFVAVLCGLLLIALPALGDVSAEYKLKAGLLFNIAKFVEWPATAHAYAASPIVIGVLGDDPFGPALEEIVRDRPINGRLVVIQRARRLEELPVCHVLFISDSERGRQVAILAQLGDRPVLTISESADFVSRGGVIRLLMEDQKVKFEVNAGAAEQAQLKISAQLLSLAKTVFHAKGGNG
jgi:hypothetical protein